MTSNIKVLYEDDNIIVCVKPAGVLSQGDKKGNKDMVRVKEIFSVGVG